MKKIIVGICFLTLVGNVCAQQAKPPVIKAVPVSVKKLHAAIDSAMDEGNYEYALQKCNEILAAFPKDTLASERKIGALYFLHKIDECIAWVKKVHTGNDSAAFILSVLSLQRDDRETTDSATVWADRDKIVTVALSLNKDNVYANMSKAILQTEAKKYDDAIMYINNAVMHADDSIKAGIRLVKCGIYSDMADYASAEKELHAVINDYSDQEDAYDELIKFYRERNRYADALNALDAHAKKFNKEEEDKDVKYYILRDWGKKDEACAVAEQIQDNLYVLDNAAALGCTWPFAPLKNNIGAEYVYSVMYNGSDYDFTVTHTSGNYASDLSFDWSLADNSKGKITLTKVALDTAREQVNKFGSDMDSIVLDNKTTVWVSRNIFNDITTKGETNINADGTLRKFKIATDEDEETGAVDKFYQDITYNDAPHKYLHLIHLYSDDDQKYQIWINNDAANPLIIKMMLDFDIELKSIKE